jgi:hypothetical protein
MMTGLIIVKSGWAGVLEGGTNEQRVLPKFPWGPMQHYQDWLMSEKPKSRPSKEMFHVAREED